MSTSQGVVTTTVMVPQKKRLVMPAALFKAAMKGDGDALVRYLGLPDGDPNHSKVQIDDGSDPTSQQLDCRFDIQSATNSGNTILHILVTQGHNELALKVFQNEVSLLKAQNKKFETPLHCAAKVGNENVVLKLIKHNPNVVKDALNVTNDNGDTALHVAAKHGSINVGHEMMKSSPKLAHSVNDKSSSPLHIAITNEYTEMAQAMLSMDATLACIEDSDGMFPVHIAASMGNKELVKHFIEKYYDYAEFLDPHGRNLFHIAAEKNHNDIFLMLRKWDGADVFDYFARKTLDDHENLLWMQYHHEDINRMINARDYEGNTPLHIAAINKHMATMKVICSMLSHAEKEVKNKQGLTPAEICIRHLKETNKNNVFTCIKIHRYIKYYGKKFTPELIKYVCPPDTNIWERIQVIGLGAVLITTVAFAAAFTIPGGYNQENGTPVFARRYIFKAFILANTLAFITGFISLFSLLADSIRTASSPNDDSIQFPITFFFIAAISMVVAFGLGLYLTLAPNNMSVAILILVSTLIIGSPFGFGMIMTGHRIFEEYAWIMKYVLGFFTVLYIFPFIWIFCLAFL